jgi:hypothetical protein
MKQATDVEAKDPFAALATIDMDTLPSGPVDTNEAPKPAMNSLTEQVVEAYQTSLAWLTTLRDDATRAIVENRLKTSSVRGSIIYDINSHADVEAMLAKVTDWTEVIANLKDKEITVLQGTLPDGYSANAAYATVTEIGTMFGAPGVENIKPKIGQHEGDGYYQCTLQRMPTNVITVQIKKDGSGIPMVHAFFAGIENSSRRILSYGDTLVRCGVQLQRVDGGTQGSGKKFQHRHQDRRHARH